MSAVSDPDIERAEDWSDEWNADDWYELNRADRDYRNEDSWSDWLIKFGIVAVVLPLVLGLLVWALIVLL